jgi:hypothetical protein
MRSLFAVVLSLAAVAAAPVRAAVIEGQVVEAGTGTPIAGATVSVVAPGFLFIPFIVATGQTATDGRYRIDTGLFEGPVAAIGTAPGFAARTQAGERCPDNPTFCYHAATKITLSNTTPSTAGFTLGHAARIRGTVRDRTSGVAVTSGYVHVRYVGAPNLAHLSTTLPIEDDGHFELTGLHGGTYEFRASVYAAGGGRRYLSYVWPELDCDDVQVLCSDLPAQPLSIADGGLLDGIDIGVRAGAFVRTRMISDGNGAAIEHNASVSAATHPSQRLDGYTAEDGWSLTGPLLPGAVKVEVHPYFELAYPAKVYPNLPCTAYPCDLTGAPAIDIPAGATITLDDVHVAPLRTVRGRITDIATGQPIAGATVAVGDHSPPIFGFWGLVAEATAQTDSDGRYSIEGFTGEDVAVFTRQAPSGWIDRAWQNVECGGANRFCNDMATPFTRPDFVLQPHPTGIDFAIERGATLSGRVVFANGSPAAGYAVVAVPAAHGLVGKPVHTDNDGNFTVGGLTAEPYYLFASEHDVFPQTYGAIWPDRPCSVPSIDTPLDCSPTAAQQLAPTPGGVIGNLTIVMPGTDTIFADRFE